MPFNPFHQREQTMHHRLLGYMLVLIAVVLSALLASLSLMGRFSSDKRELVDTLELQLNFWEKELLTHSDALAAMGLGLSRSMSLQTEESLRAQGLSFDALTENSQAQTELQTALLPRLQEYLLRTDASGAYVLLDTSVAPEARSRCGIYLQRSSTSPVDDKLLLYRGRAAVGKQFGIMPHRKWRLELGTELFCNDENQIPRPDIPVERIYSYTPVFTLPGTSEQAILLQVPIRGSDGTFFGVCGFEINQTYFKKHHAQPAIYPQLTFLLTSQESDGSLSASKLVSGTTSDYFFSPAGLLTAEAASSDLLAFHAEQHDFVGLQRTLSLSPGGAPSTAAVMLPREDYQHILRDSLRETLLLFALMMAFAVTCCVFFSQKYLLPILRGLEQMKSQAPTEDSGVQEIDDLFSFLMLQNQEHEDALRVLESEKESAQSRASLIQDEYDRIRQEYETAKAGSVQLSSLQSIDLNSTAYQTFRQGLAELTPKEREIIQYYFQGHTVPEIQELMNIKETTLRYHNRNIYGKLGVHSMKQLLQFAVCINDQNSRNRP